MKKGRNILMGILSGVLVFLSGFVVMYLLWTKLGSPQGLPGFFSYRAATIGDGLCLPVLTGTMVMFTLRNKAFYVQRRKKCLIISLATALVAIGIQASWLISDTTVLNWSIPIQHHFNVAGWYHSLFFVAIFGIVAYQLCAMWFVLKERQCEYVWSERVIYALFVFAGSLFLFMHMTDDYSQYLSISILLSIVATGILLLVVIYSKAATKTGSGELLPATTMGIISAYSMSLMICMPMQQDIVIALSGGLCVCFIWRIHNLSVTQIVLKDIWTIIFYFIALYKISSLTDIWELGATLLFLIVTTAICEETSNKEAKTRAISFLAVAGYLLLNIFPIEIQEIDEVANFLFMITICCLFKKEITNYFSEVKEAEGKLGKNNINKQQYKEIKTKAYLQIVIGILAAILLILHWLFGIAREIGITIVAGTWHIPIGLIGIMFLTIVILVIVGIKQLRKYMIAKIAALILSGFLFVGLVTCIILNIGISSFMIWSPISSAMLGCSVCACIGTGILSAHGYYMNMVWLRGLHGKKLIVAMALVQGIGSTSVVSAITVLTLCRQTWKDIILIGIATVAIFIIIPVLHARVFQCNYNSSHVVGNKPLSGIAQDGLMICLIVFFVICMPCLYVSLSTRRIIAWIETVTLISTALPPISYCLRNNVEHMRKQRKVLAEYPEEEEIWDTLHQCLVRQSKQTIFASFPYILIAAIVAYGSRMMKNMDRGDIPWDIYKTYIDADDYDRRKKMDKDEGEEEEDN